MLNAAIVGLGGWGQTLVRSVQDKSELIRFVAGATRTRSKAEEFATTNGIRLLDDLAAVIADPAVEAIVLATPHLDHVDQVEMIAAAGKPVYVEKPFALTQESAERAVAAAERAGITLAVGHNRRFHPSMGRLRSMIREGRLGKILHCHASLTTTSGLFLAPDGWRSDPHQSPAGGMTGLGIHLVDGMIDLFGKIESVACQSVHRAVPSGAEDTTSVLLRLTSGQTASLLALTATTPGYEFSVYGSQGMAQVSSPTLETFTWQGVAPSVAAARTPPPAETEVTAGVDSVRLALEAFAGAATGGAPFPIRHDEIIHGVAVLEAIIKAANTGRFVTIA
ncbi:putative oxidoreductase YvaA [Hartmannibacter diazotrophicus]|uniref:Putative oxidoreductase YvaA n=1 Tax=Hartmannibacter diazotrophicus TaxID=1482074 RepID=A0A2C9D8Q8_9HYPH|nr:Gfo/Idh/MocA family oxidoreductase [Hartmannibacter diazotrophicus]SON56687.1 putative oxidoreductase YvaA [Hartmannibacter diazotrophicus]